MNVLSFGFYLLFPPFTISFAMPQNKTMFNLCVATATDPDIAYINEIYRYITRCKW